MLAWVVNSFTLLVRNSENDFTIEKCLKKTLCNPGQIIYYDCLSPFSGQGVPGVPKIKENYNPATWMLEVTSPSAEAKLELDFASFYQESNLCRYRLQSSEVKRHGAWVLNWLKSKSICLKRAGNSKEYNNKALASNLPHQHLLHQTKWHYVHVLCRENRELVKILSSPVQGSKELHFPTRFPLNGWQQFSACIWKLHLTYWRSPHYNLARYLVFILSSLLFGALLWQKGKKM